MPTRTPHPLNDRTPAELSERGRKAAAARDSTAAHLRALAGRRLTNAERAQLIALLLVAPSSTEAGEAS